MEKNIQHHWHEPNAGAQYKPNQPAGPTAGKSREEVGTVTLIKRLIINIIITTTTYHLQGSSLTHKHIELKNICYVRDTQGKNKTKQTPKNTHTQFGQEIYIGNFVAFHPTTK